MSEQGERESPLGSPPLPAGEAAVAGSGETPQSASSAAATLQKGENFGQTRPDNGLNAITEKVANSLPSIFSGRALAARRKRSYSEAKFLQNQRQLSLSNRDRLCAEANQRSSGRIFGWSSQRLPKFSSNDPGRQFLYVNSAFAPAPDEIVGNLHKCFRDSKGDLVVNYATTPAWG